MRQETELSFTGRSYRVMLRRIGTWRPLGPASFILDADQFFDTAEEIALTEGSPRLLVGIGLPEFERQARILRRYFELTDTAGTETFSLRQGLPVPQTGGERLFAGFLQNRLMPFLADQAPVAAESSAIFGHSLAGLFVLRAFLRRDLPIAKYFAADPAVWWNRHRLMQELNETLAQFPDSPAIDTRRLTILAAGRRHPRAELPTTERNKLEAVRAGPNGIDFGTRLADAGHRYVATFLLPEETHGSMVRPALRRFFARPARHDENDRP
ncbi:alpha/beta hydrolase [Jiella mangrovi]|uniref:Alpha/beta hydrolase n=1 Tax=Jiella mangrovi TaxID=2821407 RepID=A0ABS4BLG4_9HYPH|nr:alpha/beta hydrolase-fold protein [Jiella mangrovi]MBP0617583.1 alpha/beta hydrolase [Jiella mangrovi]